MLGSTEVIVYIYLMMVQSGGLRLEPDQSAVARPRHPSPLSRTRGTNEPFIRGARHVNQITSVTSPPPAQQEVLGSDLTTTLTPQAAQYRKYPGFDIHTLNGPEPTLDPYLNSRQMLENSFMATKNPSPCSQKYAILVHLSPYNKNHTFTYLSRMLRSSR